MGRAISVNLLVFKASKMDWDIHDKIDSVKYSCIKHWMAKKTLSILAVTHDSQMIPEETIAKAKAFVIIQVPFLIGPLRGKKWIDNMDQIPVYFSMTPRTLLLTRFEQVWTDAKWTPI